jgi:TonB family protein
LLALLLHFGVPAIWLLLQEVEPVTDLPHPIAVALVEEPTSPKAEPTSPKAEPKTPEKGEQQPFYRRSGPDAETTTVRPTPPVEAPPAPVPAPPPPAEAPEPPTHADTPPAPTETPPAAPPTAPPPTVAETPPPPEAIPVPPPKPPAPEPAKPSPAKQPTKSSPSRTDLAQVPHPPIAPGTREQRGDPYFNAVMERIRPHLAYPPLARNLALRGTTILIVALARDGRVLGIRVAQSSGAEILDRAAIQSIRDAMPLPAPPPPPPGAGDKIFEMDVTIPFSPD